MKQADGHVPRAGGRKRAIKPGRTLRVVEGSRPAPVGNAVRKSTPDSRSETFAALFRRLGETDGYHVEAAKIDIAEEIYVAMETQDITRAELARRLGRSRQYVTKILRGSANFTLESLVKISLALGRQLEVKMAPAKSAQPGVQDPRPSQAPQ